MNKMAAILCLLSVLMLAACGTNNGNTEEAAGSTAAADGQTVVPSNDQSNDQNDDQRVFEQIFGEPFYFERSKMADKSQVMLTLTDHGIVKERHSEDRYKDDTDYLKVFVQVENVGDQNSSDAVIDFSSIKAYNSNGVEVSKLTAFTSLDIRYVDGEFKAAELRPNGKNEGYLYIPIEEGADPAEIIFFESTTEMLLPYVKQYVFQR